MLGNLSGWHLLILVVVILLIFGAARLPALAKSLGQSARILKSETKDLTRGSDRPATEPSPVADDLPETSTPSTVTESGSPAASQR